MSELYDCSTDNISLHLKNIYNDLELDKESTTEDFSIVQKEGNREVKRNIKYYNLDAVISVGYRVNSDRAIQFRRWATNILKEFSKKGYIIDKKRMENGTFFDEDYYDSLLAEIREIRLSERRFYQKITDIYATSVDYDSKAPTTIKFFKKVQNKTKQKGFFNMADKTIELKQNFAEALSKVSTMEDLENLRVEYTGKKGHITGLMQEMKNKLNLFKKH